MGAFNEKQTGIIDAFFRTGKINNQQTAVILPALVRWIFEDRPELKEKLKTCYGPQPENVMQGLGADLLEKNGEAEILLDAMLSNIRREN